MNDEEKKRQAEPLLPLWLDEEHVARDQTPCERPCTGSKVQGVRSSFPGSHRVKSVVKPVRGRRADRDETESAIAGLAAHFEKIKADQAFFEMNASEVRGRDDFWSLKMVETREQLRVERALLAGHAAMVQDRIVRQGATPGKDAERLLERIRVFAASA